MIFRTGGLLSSDMLRFQSIVLAMLKNVEGSFVQPPSFFAFQDTNTDTVSLCREISGGAMRVSGRK